MKQFLLSVLIVVCSLSFLNAQDVTPESEQVIVAKPNNIKINSLALIFQNISLIYERSIMPRLTVGLGVGYKYAGTEPSLFSVNDASVGVNLDKIQGITISPEARYYLRACDPTKMEGFYGGVYLRYTGYGTMANFEYQPNEGNKELYQADLNLQEFGAGIQLGYQLIIKDRVSVDFLFFGPRFSRYTLSYEFTETPSEEFLGDLSDYLNDVVDRLGFDYEVDVKKDGETSAKTSFSFANTRFGISLGYNF